jgi:hypothetical protein
MTRPHVVLAFGLSSLAGMTLGGVTSASAQIFYVDEGAYAAPPAYVVPAVPPGYYLAPQGPGYYLAPQGYVAAPAYTVPTAPLAVVPVAPQGYVAAPAYRERVVPVMPRDRVTRRVIGERRSAYPRYDYNYGYDSGYVTYEER